MRSHSGTNRNPTIDIDREIAQQGIPSSCHNTYRKAHTGSRPAAIKAMCLMCQGWDDGARKAVRDCADVGCPLWSVRPFQGKNVSDDDGDGEPEEQTNPALHATDIRERILGVLTDELLPKSYIIQRSGIDPQYWNETMRALVDEGLVERIGERRFTAYRRAQL